MTKFLRDNYLILIIFLAGLTLRLYHLGSESIWYDEAYSVDISSRGVIDIVRTVMGDSYEANPPLYYIMLHFWIGLTGNSEISLRLLSAVPGSLCIVAVYAIGKKMFNKNTGLMAALILSVSAYHIQMSQEARGYTLNVLLTIISFYSLYLTVSKKNFKHTAIYILTSVLLLYTHYYGIFILFTQNVFFLTVYLYNRGKKNPGFIRWVLIQSVILISFIPAIRRLLIYRSNSLGSLWITEPTIERLGEYAVSYAGNLYLLIIFSFLTVAALVGRSRLARIGAFERIVDDAPDRENESMPYGLRTYMLIIWMVLPVLIPVIYSLVANPIFASRYAISSTVAFYLLAAYGIDCINYKRFAVPAGLAVVLLSAPAIAKYYTTPVKPQWRQVMNEIESNAQVGDIVTVYPGHELITAIYYRTKDDLIMVPVYDKFPDIPGTHRGSVWIITHSHPTNRRLFREGLGGIYYFESERGFLRLDLFRLRRK